MINVKAAHLFVGSFGLAVVSMGCVDTPAQTEPSGSSEIARFVVEESADRTVVAGLDHAGNEVARLDLVHGRFALSPPFTEDYETPEVDGRSLKVNVRGQRLAWETAGYEPVLQMPAHPASQAELAAFLADPHAKAVLDRWQIGFEPFHGALDLADETAYVPVSGTFRGGSQQACNNATSCGTAYYGTINTCGGGAAATTAARVTQKSGTNCGLYSSSYNQVLLSQCCPAGSGGQSLDWFAQKACPTTSSNGTVCGTRTSGACKACPTYPAEAFTCTVSTGSSVGTCSAVTVYQGNYGYNSNECPPPPTPCDL